MAYLALIRHGESEWNAMDMWTGLTDVQLTDKGKREAVAAGKQIRDIHWDFGYTSALKRSQETMDGVREGSEQMEFPITENAALNERDYGNFTGLHKAEVEEKYGWDLFEKWHRGWDYPLPHGETLKDVFARVVPYYQTEILPKIMSGQNVIVCAHGNSLRALAKFLNNISDEEIEHFEMGLGDVYLYQIDEKGSVIDQDLRRVKI